jgi:hypothetical protein
MKHNPIRSLLALLPLLLLSLHCKSHPPEKIFPNLPTFPSEAALLASLLSDSLTESTTLVTPFFHHTTIQRIEKRLPTHPIVYYFSKGPEGKVLNLTGNTEKFETAAVEDILLLHMPEDAIAYTNTMFEACKSRNAYIVDREFGFRFVRKLSPEETQRSESLKQTYEKKMQGPVARVDGGMFLVSYLYVEDQNLYGVRMELSRIGRFTEETILLEKDLPVHWVR